MNMPTNEFQGPSCTATTASPPAELSKSRSLDKEQIKSAMAGHCRMFLKECYRFDPPTDSSKEHPCPKCGGNTRSRPFADYESTGGYFCSHCFDSKNGDFLATGQWWSGRDFRTVLADAFQWLTDRGLMQAEISKPVKISIASGASQKKLVAKRKYPKFSHAIIALSMGIFNRRVKPCNVWHYQDETGNLVGSILRWNLPTGGKEIRQVRLVEGDQFELGGMASPRPLYELPKLMKSQEVWICEGEKAAEALQTCGVIATTPSQGAQSPHKTDWSTLNGKRVRILPDNDEAGWKFARMVFQLLQKHAPSAIVTIHDLKDDWPDLPAKGDAADWSEQNDAAEVETLKSRLLALPDRTAQALSASDQTEASSMAVSESFLPSNFDSYRSRFVPGERVKCGDRNNVGHVIEDEGGIDVFIRFVSKDGVRVQKHIPRSQVTSLDRPNGENKPVATTYAGEPAASLWPLADTPVDWIIENVFSADQPTIFGAKQKTLKTTLLTDLVVAVATGFPWLNRFKVPRQRKVLFITGEASQRAAIKKVRRAAEARNLNAKDIADWIHIEALHFPSLTSADHCFRVTNDVAKHEFELVVLDPLYMGLEGVNTANLTEVGPAMRQFMQACRPANVVIAHHVKKSANYNDAPNLEDLSQAGIAEFAGNYWLMGRMSEYTGNGLHELAVRYGGRDEQFGLMKIDFDEQNWTTEITCLMGYREEKRLRTENAMFNQRINHLKDLLKRNDGKASLAQLAEAINTKPLRPPFRNLIEYLCESGLYEECKVKGGNNKLCDGLRVKEQASADGVL